MILLCPQIGCGHPMVLSGECAWNERGPACCDCTREWKTRPPMYEAVEKQYSSGVGQEKRCLQCNEPLENNTAYIYPHGIYMCKRHNTSAMQRAVTDPSGSGIGTREALVKYMLQVIKDRKQNKHDNSLGYYKRQLSRKKMTNRNRNKH